MSATFDSLTNRGEYFAAHYFAEQLATDLRKGVFARWAEQEGDENDPRPTPRQSLRALRGTYLTEDVRGLLSGAISSAPDGEEYLRTYGDPQWVKCLQNWHQDVLRALGFDPAPTELTVHRSGREHHVPVAFHGHGVVALDCGWTATADAVLTPEGAGRLVSPLRVSGQETYETGAALATWLFQSEIGHAGGPPPRFVILLTGGVIVLADRSAWNEGRYLAANLDAALERNDRAQQGELATIAALFSPDLLRPGDNDRAPTLDALLKASSDNAVGVSKDLRHGLRRSVEIIANEVLQRMGEPANDVTWRDIADPKIDFAKELTRECLRYLYRILFLLYAEARPELRILPADDGSYEAGYSIARLRELVARDTELVEEESRNGFHLFESLDVLFDKVNGGHRRYGTEPDDDLPGDDEETRKLKEKRRSEDRGLRFEALRSQLFEPDAVRIIGHRLRDPRRDDDDPHRLDLRLRNSALHTVLRLLTMKPAKRGERGGFVSYRNLGINQLGAVYEGLMSYTGIIAQEELCEVAKGGDPEEGSWLIPAHRQNDYPDATLVTYDEDDARRGLRGVKKYDKGSFVYRLSGRERETSASYYTPESLTRVTVELALKHRLDQQRDSDGNTVRTRAAELLTYRICEPALGSGAFLNEAINQLAEEYLRRRQDELQTSIPSTDVLTEKQKVKAYIALHNAYGVDLNPTGVELAEVSLWLNTMHPGMQAPWFGLHLRRGNSLFGARRAVYAAEDVTSTNKAWLKAKGGLAPTPLPFLADGHPQLRPEDAVHQFLLPSPGWAAITTGKDSKLANTLAGEPAAQLTAWRKGILQRPARKTTHLLADGSPKLDPKTGRPRPEPASQYTRLRDAARRAEFLWSLVVKRMEISEREVSRRIDVWGANPTDPEYAFLRQPRQAVPKEKVLDDLFNAADTPYWRLKKVMDAWCALWFWPPDHAGLLDGTDPEYAGRDLASPQTLAALLRDGPVAVGDDSSGASDDLIAAGGAALAPRDDQAAGPDAVTGSSVIPAESRVPGLVSIPALFNLIGEQTSFDDLGWLDDSVETLVSAGQVEKQKQAKASGRNSRTRARTAWRRAIPLGNLDDWLDFLEAMLGTADIPEGTLLDSFQTLEKLKDFETALPGFMGMDTTDPEQRFPWMRVVRDIAEDQGFLHWELEFALVFARGGGFDLQVGNPPWVRPRWNEDAVLAEHEPWFVLEEKASEEDKEAKREKLLALPRARDYVLSELTRTSAHVALLSSPQVYPLLTGTQPDLYRAFMCQVWNHAASAGTTGMLHTDTHFSGDKEAPLREEAYRRLRVHGDFVNSGQRFFPRPVGDTSHFGVHVYGPPQQIAFDHLSWLVSTDALRHSAAHDGSGEIPGVRYRNGEFDERPHKTRVVKVTEEILAVWQRLLDEADQPVAQGRLLFPVSTAEAAAIEALADYSLRLGALDPQISPGLHESGAKAANLIDYNRIDPTTGREYQPGAWSEVILKGVQLGTATPVFKRHDANSNDPFGADLVDLPPDYVPDTAYVPARGRHAAYRDALERDRWVDHVRLAELRADPEAVAEARALVAERDSVPQEDVAPEVADALLVDRSRRSTVTFPRVAWRAQIAPNTERALYASLIPPGPSHIHGVHSLAMGSVRATTLVSGFWASMPLDYFLRATGRTNLQVSAARGTPAPFPGHPLASALLLRTLRLNCLTSVFAGLWAELYDGCWRDRESWACAWPGLPPLQDVAREWQPETPLRTERARRSALVEIDALVAVWLGMSADALVAAYRGRFPVLQKYEAVTWFDANGHKLAGDARTRGQRQSKESWAQLQEHLQQPDRAPVPVGYAAPFHKADREAEMRKAHEVFQARLDAAIARGEWDPARREVPKR
jgi:hypothetical protein